MARVYNFSAGPSMLPEEVLKTAAAEMMEYGESGQSVMEMSHRSKEYQAIFDEAVAEGRLEALWGGDGQRRVSCLPSKPSTQRLWSTTCGSCT